MPVNEENVLKVIKAINAEEYLFDMHQWIGAEDDHGNCGTTACIGGHAELIMVREGVAERKDIFQDEVADWLGISINESDLLFFEYPSDRPASDEGRVISRGEAVKVLENLIETGEVDWGILDGQ